MESDLATALGKPNPQIKGQTALFLKRAFIKLNSTTMPKKTLKALAPLLVKVSEGSDHKSHKWLTLNSFVYFGNTLLIMRAEN